MQSGWRGQWDLGAGAESTGSGLGGQQDLGGGTRLRVRGVSRLSVIDELRDFGSGSCLELAFLINTRFL